MPASVVWCLQATYSGWFPSTVAQVSSAFGNKCPAGMFCKFATGGLGDIRVCDDCTMPVHAKCPKGSSYLFSGGKEYCSCRKACTGLPGWENTPDAKCTDSEPSSQWIYEGCFQTTIEFANGGSGCYKDVKNTHDIFPLTCTTCQCNGIAYGGEPVTPVFGFGQAATMTVCLRHNAAPRLVLCLSLWCVSLYHSLHRRGCSCKR